MHTSRIVFASVAFAAAIWALGGTATTTSPHFYRDDPIARELESRWWIEVHRVAAHVALELDR